MDKVMREAMGDAKMRCRKNDLLLELINSNQNERAITWVRYTQDYHEAEEFVFTVLFEEKTSPELIEAVLEVFFNSRPNKAGNSITGGGHGGWVHSLSHFTVILWARRMDEWIKKFNQVSFRGAIELGDHSCCDRLVEDFGKFAKFNDNAADFHLIPENLTWIKEDWDLLHYAVARIKVGQFESEEAFLHWKLSRPETHTYRDGNLWTRLVDVEGIRAVIQRLQELGADTSEFNGLERDLLTKQLSNLEEKRNEEMPEWKREQLDKAIQKTRETLAS